MLVIGSLEKAKKYIEAKDKELSKPERRIEHGVCVTISRETGAGADRVANILVEKLKNFRKENSPEWTIFDKNLIQKVLDEHHLPLSIAGMMEEDYSSVSSIMKELFSSAPPSWNLIQKTSQTILQLARTGNCIIVGRAANAVTAQIKNCFHVRLIAPLEERIKHVEEVYGLKYSDAHEFLRKEDDAREKYIWGYFHKRIDDPLIYHIVVNTKMVGYEASSQIIADGVKAKYPLN